jgi:hypothetical protein
MSLLRGCWRRWIIGNKPAGYQGLKPPGSVTDKTGADEQRLVEAAANTDGSMRFRPIAANKLHKTYLPPRKVAGYLTARNGAMLAEIACSFSAGIGDN